MPTCILTHKALCCIVNCAVINIQSIKYYIHVCESRVNLMMSYLWPNKRPRLLREKLFWWWQQWGGKLFPSFVRIDHSILLLAEYFISDRLNASKIVLNVDMTFGYLWREYINNIFFLFCSIWCFGWELESFPQYWSTSHGCLCLSSVVCATCKNYWSVIYQR